MPQSVWKLLNFLEYLLNFLEYSQIFPSPCKAMLLPEGELLIFHLVTVRVWILVHIQGCIHIIVHYSVKYRSSQFLPKIPGATKFLVLVFTQALASPPRSFVGSPFSEVAGPWSHLQLHPEPLLFYPSDHKYHLWPKSSQSQIWLL